MGGIADALFGKKDREKPKIEQPKKIDSREADEAREDERRRRRREGGRASTILTSPLGLTSPARVSAKVLTGS